MPPPASRRGEGGPRRRADVPAAGGAGVVTCVDVGSTYTKAALVDTGDGELLATAAGPTTAGTDVLDGLDAAVAAVGGAGTPLYVCSSAGGGLRLAVVGYESLVTAEAGHRVGLSAGARVVHVSAGRLDRAGVAALRAARPDVVLLVGGTDGGDAEVLLGNAARLAATRLRVPVVVAGNTDVREEVTGTLAAGGVPAVATANVLPRIGELVPGPARAAIREVFLRHVIGGKGLSRGGRFASLVRAATPDAVLTGVEVLADSGAGDVVVVDVGGATTDVYSVLTPDAERAAGPRREVAGTLWRSRTVEGDLGVRWNAPGIVAAAIAERLLEPGVMTSAGVNPGGVVPGGVTSGAGFADVGFGDFEDAAARRARDPGFVPGDDTERDVDARLAALAMTVALRRHARGEAVTPSGPQHGGKHQEAVTPGGPRRGGKDLREVRLLVGSGGVLRYATPQRLAGILAAPLADHAGGWPLPRSPRRAVDGRYTLAAAGLLAADHPAAAARLATSWLDDL